jgi:hypothetical protein
MAFIRPGSESTSKLRGIKQFLHAYASGKTKTFHKRNEIFGSHVAACAGAERTATQSADRGVEGTHTGIEARQDICEGPAISVVKVKHEITGADF